MSKKHSIYPNNVPSYPDNFPHYPNNIPKQKQQEREIEFDADSPPDDEHNIEAAKARGLCYNPESECYEDEDGCPTRDCFGQELG